MANQEMGKFDRLLLTGAAGGIGKVIRPRVAEFAAKIRVSDLPPALTSGVAAHEEVMPFSKQGNGVVDSF